MNRMFGRSAANDVDESNRDAAILKKKHAAIATEQLFIRWGFTIKILMVKRGNVGRSKSPL